MQRRSFQSSLLAAIACPALPWLATPAQAGHAQALVQSWYGVAAPAKTPAAIVAYLSEQFLASLAQAETRARLEALDADILALGAPAFDALIETEFKRWGELIRKRGIKAA